MRKQCFDVYFDSDHAGDQTDRKSVTSYVCMLGVHCLATHVDGQLVVALSSGEAELYAMGSAAAAGIELKNLHLELGREVHARVHSDSSAARGMASRLGSGKVKVTEARFLWIQERRQQ